MSLLCLPIRGKIVVACILQVHLRQRLGLEESFFSCRASSHTLATQHQPAPTSSSPRPLPVVQPHLCTASIFPFPFVHDFVQNFIYFSSLLTAVFLRSVNRYRFLASTSNSDPPSSPSLSTQFFIVTTHDTVELSSLGDCPALSQWPHRLPTS